MKHLVRALRHPLFRTRNDELADRSRFQWREGAEPGVWELSTLGIINGLFPFGRVLVVMMPDGSGGPEHWGLSVRKKWW